jgi:hypothetical protein
MSNPDQNNDIKPIHFKAVLVEERKVIQKLRINNETEKIENIDKTPENLVGIAFSGGGIRSATFGLGVLEALKSEGILKKIDYLSTVSGGGYIGGWLSANCYQNNERKKEQTKQEPSWLEEKADWKESINYLRRYSNYLAPNVSLLSADTWSMVTIWLRNTLLIQLMIVLAIAGLLLLPRLIAPIVNFGSLLLLQGLTVIAFCYLVYWIAGTLKQIKIDQEPKTYKPWWLIELIPLKESKQKKVIVNVGLLMLISLGVSAMLWTQIEQFRPNTFSNCIALIYGHDKPLVLLSWAALILFSACSSRDYTLKKFLISYPAISNIITNVLFSIPVIVVLWLLLAATLYLLNDWVCIAKEGGSILAFAWAPPMVLSSFALSINLLIGMQGKGSYEYVREWWSRFGAWLAICGLVWMLGVAIAFYGPLWSAMLYYDGSWKSLGTGWIGTTLAGLLAGKSATTSGLENNSLTTKAKEMLAKVAPFVFIAGLFIVVSMTLHLMLANISDKNFNMSKDYLLGAASTEEVTQVSLLRHDVKPEDNQASLPNCTDNSTPECLKQWDSHDQAIYWLKDVPFNPGTQQVINDEPLFKYPDYWKNLAHIENHLVWIFVLCLGSLLLSGVLLSWRIDINEFSLNAFYRNRLARCYLGATRFWDKEKYPPNTDKYNLQYAERKPNEFTGFDNDDDLKLSSLAYRKDKVDKPCEPYTNSPFHIVNCTLNLPGSSDLALHTRHSAIFTLTPLYCGSSYHPRKANDQEETPNRCDGEIGYIPTESFCGTVNQPTLGQAISVSGAAASPNMGYHTSAPVAFLMTLFNARLGWWFPNPYHVKNDDLQLTGNDNCQQSSPRFSLTYLLNELFGMASEKSAFLAISDGGHFENLAAYELVKRKCKVIIISDAECDPKLQFEGLANLIRLCEVDGLAKITIDVQPIHPEKTITKKTISNIDTITSKRIEEFEWSESRCAIGEIKYVVDKDEKPIPDGFLIYIKASMNGEEGAIEKEGTAVMQYKATHPDFPHESTSNQFYGEDQFESYRWLGQAIAEEALTLIKGESKEKTEDKKQEYRELKKLL